MGYKKKRFSDDPEIQSNRVYEDPYLFQVYSDVLKDFKDVINNKKSKKLVCIELGSAGGITKLIDDKWITSDIRFSKKLDIIFSATQMPFKADSIDLIYCQDVIHHIPDFTKFISEVTRVSKNGTEILIKEPYWGLFAQFIWRFLHPEDFSLKRLMLIQNFFNPMDGNQALAWALIKKKKSEYVNLLSSFEIIKIGPRLSLSFVLSGGSTFSTSISRKFLIDLYNFEKKNKFVTKFFCVAYLFILRINKDVNEK